MEKNFLTATNPISDFFLQGFPFWFPPGHRNNKQNQRFELISSCPPGHRNNNKTRVFARFYLKIKGFRPFSIAHLGTETTKKTRVFARFYPKIKGFRPFSTRDNCGTDNCGTDNCGTDNCGTDNCGTDNCGPDNHLGTETTKKRPHKS